MLEHFMELRYFREAGFCQDEQNALSRLENLLAAEAVDTTTVSIAVRELARRHTGWVPVTG
ncbi:MAG: hypothetical protein GY835_22840 [bacterium]|nr:hypothetical protein [bacterium]